MTTQDSQDGTPASTDLHFGLVLVCFALSGFAALLYETAWVRQFAFVFGTSDLAVATVLAAYFGGLTAGAAAAARFAHRIKRPILAYGILELGIAAAALAVPFALRACTWVYLQMFGGQDAPPDAAGLSTAVFYLACAFMILMAPTAMMGATLPLLAKHAVRSDQELGRRVGWLYAINTMGAVAGTLCAAFVFLPAVGLSRTVLIGVAVNALVFLLAAVLAMSAPARTATAASADAMTQPGRRFGLVLPLILLSGVASFAYEVMWTRLLTQILGASVYAFATMLASFLVGITLGATIATRLARTREGSARAFGWVQIGVGLLSLAAFMVIDRLPELAARLHAGATGSLAANAALSMIILVPGALCMGAAFPLAVRAMARSETDAGPVSAQVYAWNTVGAIFGAIGTGFFILPGLGFAGTLLAVVALNLLIAALSCLLVSPPSRRMPLAAVVCGVILAMTHPGEPWRILRYSTMTERDDSTDKVEYFAVGRSATVLLLDDGLNWELRSSGLPEAFITRTEPVGPPFQLPQWLSALGVLARPDAKDMLMVGLGGGVAAGVVPSCIESIDLIELEPEIIEANRVIADRRGGDPLADPRVRMIVNDARGSLLLTDKRYDTIVSQPSHPWTSGASHLYTREFFELVRDHLDDDGVFVQWIGLPFVDEDLLKSMVATLRDVFAHVRVYQPLQMEVLFLASPAPLHVENTCAQAMELCRDDLAEYGIVSREDVAAALMLDQDEAARFSDGAPIITDDYNLLQMRSVNAYRDAQSRFPPRYFEQYEPKLADSLDLPYLVRRLLRTGKPAHARRVVERMPRSGEKATALAIAIAAEGRQADAAHALMRAVQLYPDNASARFVVLNQRKLAFLQGEERTTTLAEAADDPHRAVFEGWKLQVAGDWSALQAIDERLAMAGPLDDCYAETLRLRAAWRIHSDNRNHRDQAIAMIKQLIARFAEPGDYLLHAEAAMQAGDVTEALTAMNLALQLPRRGIVAAQVAQRARSLLDQMPPDLSLNEVRNRVKGHIDAMLAAGAEGTPADRTRPMLGTQGE